MRNREESRTNKAILKVYTNRIEGLSANPMIIIIINEEYFTIFLDTVII